ncbi:MAG TPA: IgGFc-binding protein [Polyangia bacterium]
MSMPFEGSGPPPTCQSASTVCNGGAVYECDLGQMGGPIETCSDACSGGRCVSQACAQAEAGDALRGCRFYAVQIDNIDSEDGKSMMLLLTNASSSSPAYVVVEARSPTGWDQVASDFVPAGGAARFAVTRPVRDAGHILEAALRITSDNPVLAVQLISDDTDRLSNSSSGTVLLPAQALGTAHRALTFAEKETTAVTSTVGARNGAGVITIVGTIDGTHVTLIPTALTVVAAGMPPWPAMVAFPVTLDEGDVLQVFSSGPGADLSGSTIDSDRPVAVFSGNVFTTYGADLTGFNGGDMAIEQMPPTSNWAREYVGARLAPQNGCDSFFGLGRGSWQIVASDQDTMVTLSPSPGTEFAQGLSTSSGMIQLHLKAGESLRFSTFPDPNLAPGADAPTGDFVLKASPPVLLAQWLDCSPGLSLGVDTRFFQDDLLFALPANFEHQAVIVRRLGVPVQLDGESVPTKMFFPASTGQDYEVARLTDSQLGPCLDTSVPDMCQHHLSGAAMGLSLRGMDISCSYSLTIPPAPICVLPAPGCEHF